MSVFFILLELFLYGFAVYIIWKKKELAIIYLPVLFFAFAVITPVLPLVAFYGMVALVFMSVFKKRYTISQENAFAILIFFYFILLLPQASSTIKLSLVFSVLSFFISLPLMSAIYKENTREVILKELTISAVIILIIFIANVFFATLTKYAPQSMYGISKGILYGNLRFTDFNVIGIALFVVLISILKKHNLLYLALYVIAIAFVLLTLRRSAMLVSVIGIPFAIMATLQRDAVKKIMLFVVLAFAVGSAVYFNSSFAALFRERYELRNLDERELEEEKRFIEYELLYTDMFVLKDYSPWTGYQLFNSEGNYGRGIFLDRSLHGDLANITHSSGLIGVALYLLMVMTAFYKAFRACRSKTDVLTLLFCFASFGIYTVTGRYTQAETMLLLFLVCNLSLTNIAEATEEVTEEIAEAQPEEKSNYFIGPKTTHPAEVQNS